MFGKPPALRASRGWPSPWQLGRRIIRPILFPVYLLLVTTFVVFSLFEYVPNLLTTVNLQSIRYYAQKAEYVADPTLVFVPRHGKRVVNAIEFRGDVYSPGFGVEEAPIHYRASYTDEGFRTNSSAPPFDVVVVGDSYIEFGESDESTLSELLKQESGLSTFNLGRAWYGPPQYLEIFKRYGIGTKAPYAVLGFFSGNDAEDTRQYLRWQRGGEGGDYYSFVVGRKNFFVRYLHAFRDTFSTIRHSVQRHVWGSGEMPGGSTADGSRSNGIHPDVGLIRLDGHRVPMYFTYWSPHATSKELLEREEWKRIGAVLGEFNVLARENKMTPLVVFIPTKIEVYGSLVDQQSGPRLLSRIDEQLRFQMNHSEALEVLCQEQGLRLVNLLPLFKALARDGNVLYHPFDTHWNMTGRKAAAQAIAKAMTAVSKDACEASC